MAEKTSVFFMLMLSTAGLIVPELLEDGRVKVDMGKPILNASEVPTTLPGNADGVAIAVPLKVAGSQWTVTAVSMGNPHAVVFCRDGADVKVCTPLTRLCSFLAWHTVITVDAQILLIPSSL